jgi:DNA repair photolyase
MLKHLTKLDELGFRYYFQFTLMDNPTVFEPGLPSFKERLMTFLELSNRIGASRVIWRYDPIIISNQTPASFHKEKFAAIINEIRNYTECITVSFVDYYGKTDRRLSLLEKEGFIFDRNVQDKPEASNLLETMYKISKEAGVKITTCAEKNNYSNVGVTPGRCIDGDLINRLWSIKVSASKDPGQRDACLCVVSKDIGINDTCLHGCKYCYSTRSSDLALKRFKEHNRNDGTIWGPTRDLTEVEQINQSKLELL